MCIIAVWLSLLALLLLLCIFATPPMPTTHSRFEFSINNQYVENCRSIIRKRSSIVPIIIHHFGFHSKRIRWVAHPKTWASKVEGGVTRRIISVNFPKCRCSNTTSCPFFLSSRDFRTPIDEIVTFFCLFISHMHIQQEKQVIRMKERLLICRHFMSCNKSINEIDVAIENSIRRLWFVDVFWLPVNVVFSIRFHSLYQGNWYEMRHFWIEINQIIMNCVALNRTFNHHQHALALCSQWNNCSHAIKSRWIFYWCI